MGLVTDNRPLLKGWQRFTNVDHRYSLELPSDLHKFTGENGSVVFDTNPSNRSDLATDFFVEIYESAPTPLCKEIGIARQD